MMQTLREYVAHWGRGLLVLALIGGALVVIGIDAARQTTVSQPQVISLGGTHFKDAKLTAKNQHLPNATIQNPLLHSSDLLLDITINNRSADIAQDFVNRLPLTPPVAGFFYQLRVMPLIDFSGRGTASITLEADEYHPLNPVTIHYESWIAYEGKVEQPHLDSDLAARLTNVFKLPKGSLDSHIGEPLALGILPNYKARFYPSGALASQIGKPYKDVSLTQLPELSKKYRLAFYPSYPEHLMQMNLTKLNSDYRKALKRENHAAECDKESCVALTFDDGPDAGLTPVVLDILKQRQIKGTFFVQGSRLEHAAGATKRAAAEGHEVENHTYGHPDLVKLHNPALIRKQIDDTQAALTNIGIQAKFLRPPYGSVNDIVRAAANMPLILWNVDAQEWHAEMTPAAMAESIISQTRSGVIILMHDTKPITAQALPLVIDELQARQYRFVTVAELLQIDGSARGDFVSK